MELQELIERLEKATGPDRELDGEIADFLGVDCRECCACPIQNGYDEPPECCGNPDWIPPEYTRDADERAKAVEALKARASEGENK